jgi:hypothetical protein
MMKKRIFSVGGALLSIAALMGLFALPVSPVGADEDSPNPASSIQLSPVSQRLAMGANEAVDSKIRITNTGTNPLSFRVYATPYGVTDITYEANFDDQSDYTQIASWISFEQSEYRDVAVGEAVEVPFQIISPSDIPSGGQYAVVFAETLPDDFDSGDGAGASIQTVGRVGSLIYADLGGETRREGELLSFDQPTFAEANLKPTAQIKNSGNIDFAFSHATVVKTLFGKEVFNNSISRSVLPATTREITQEWAEAPSIGLYLVSNKISFLNQTPVDETKLVYIGPLWILITILVILGLILILIVLIIVKKIREHKKSKPTKKGKKTPKANKKAKQSTSETDPAKKQSS